MDIARIQISNEIGIEIHSELENVIFQNPSKNPIKIFYGIHVKIGEKL